MKFSVQDIHSTLALALRMVHRNRYVGFIDTHNRGYIVAFSLHWQVIEVRRVDPALGASAALGAFIAEYEAKGWQAESEAAYGFTFMCNAACRILVMATPKDPYDDALQSFTPFR